MVKAQSSAAVALVPAASPLPPQKPPPLHLPADDGTYFDLEEAASRWVVVYTYPKDDTPGCTVEACDFRDRFAAFAEAGCIVVGISPDPAVRHQKFRNKFGLPFVLVSDESRSTLASWGAWGVKTFMGRKMIGVLRRTWIIDPSGRVAAFWPKVAVKGHAEDVLAQLRALRGD